MAKLADVAAETRVILKVLGVVGVLVLLIFLGIRGVQYYIALTAPPAPPDEKLGKLVAIQFPGQKPTDYTYRINTIDGKLPPAPDRIKVFATERRQASLGALENIRNLMASSGFSDGETKISDKVYQWNNTREGSTIVYDIVNNNFKISSNFISDTPPPGLTGGSATKTGAFNDVMNFLGGLKIETDDFDPDKTKVTYLKIEDGQLVGATSQNDAQFIKVNLFQTDLEKLGVFYPSYSDSPSYFILKSQGGNSQIVDASFNQNRADLENFGEYPIKTTEEAFQDLEAGNAYLVTNGTEESPLDIIDVSMGYYIGPQAQDYLLPIYVFEGSNFKGYVNALANQ